MGLFLEQRIEAHAAEAEAVERAHFRITCAVAEQHRIAGEMDRDVMIQPLGITLDQLALRPRLAAVLGNGGDQRVALLRREWELAGVIVVEREQVGAARQALDARGAGG